MRRARASHGSVLFADHFHSRPDTSPSAPYDPTLHAQATELYRELEARTVVPVPSA